MNPKAVQVIATGAKKVFSNKYVLITLLVLIVLLIFRKRIKKVVRNRQEKKFDKKEARNVNQLAQQYRSASNPSGVSWMIDFDGTDEDLMMDLAIQSKGGYKLIADAYKQKFDESLTDRVRSELDTEDFQSWRYIID